MRRAPPRWSDEYSLRVACLGVISLNINENEKQKIEQLGREMNSKNKVYCNHIHHRKPLISVKVK